MPGKAPQRIERIYLVAERDDLTAFRSLDGTVVREREAARDRNAATLRGRTDLVVTAASEVLRLPAVPRGGRPTPARLQAVADLAQAGLLPGAVRDDLTRAGRVADNEWQLIAPLRDLYEPLEQDVETWDVVLFDSARQPLPLPVPHDPWANAEGPYPSVVVEEAVSQLAKDGWMVERIDRRYWDEADGDDGEELAQLAGEEPESTTHVLRREAADTDAGLSIR